MRLPNLSMTESRYRLRRLQGGCAGPARLAPSASGPVAAGGSGPAGPAVRGPAQSQGTQQQRANVEQGALREPQPPSCAPAQDRSAHHRPELRARVVAEDLRPELAGERDEPLRIGQQLLLPLPDYRLEEGLQAGR